MSPEPIILYFPRGTCWLVHAPPVVAALQGSNQTSSFHYWSMSPDSQIDNDRCTDFAEMEGLAEHPRINPLRSGRGWAATRRMRIGSLRRIKEVNIVKFGLLRLAPPWLLQIAITDRLPFLKLATYVLLT